MKRALLYLWRHPRRTGFIAFNVIVLLLLWGWAAFTEQMSRQGIGGLPNLALGYTGMAIAVAALVVGWIAWAFMVSARHARHAAAAEARASTGTTP
jgi:hypothetical protein